MTINSMLPAYREEANNTTKDNNVKSCCNFICATASYFIRLNYDIPPAHHRLLQVNLRVYSFSLYLLHQ